MRLPTVKTILRVGIDTEKATAIRKLMEKFKDKHPFSNVFPGRTMNKINDIIDGHGVESIRRGKTLKSPAITYVNLGDCYDTTVMWVQGNFVVGDWGSIVERGCYD